LRTGIPAIITAGDRKASRAIYGDSKAYLVVAGRPLVAHVVATLQAVPEVSEVWVVGNASRLEDALGIAGAAQRAAQAAPRRAAVPQPVRERLGDLSPRAAGAPDDGRDPTDDDGPALFLSERSAVRDAARDLRVHPPLVRDGCRLRGRPRHRRVDALVLPGSAGQGRHPHGLLQSARGPVPPEQPAPDPARPRAQPHYVEEMYEHRHQREFCEDHRARVAPVAQRARRLRRARLLRPHAPRGRARSPRHALARGSRAALDPARAHRARHARRSCAGRSSS
jgi:hypothetical protein